jgi:hypothetical protein
LEVDGFFLILHNLSLVFSFYEQLQSVIHLTPHHDITIVVGCKGWNYKLDGEDGIVGEKMDTTRL